MPGYTWGSSPSSSTAMVTTVKPDDGYARRYLAVQPWLLILHVDLQLNRLKVVLEDQALQPPAPAPQLALC